MTLILARKRKFSFSLSQASSSWFRLLALHFFLSAKKVKILS